MRLYLKLAWRNLFRNKRRSLIAGIAIGLGLASLIFVDALMIGMENNMVKSATSSFLGEGQIHRAGFRETQTVELTIANLEQVVADLQRESSVRNFTTRVLAFGMLSSPANVSALSVVGVNPETERALAQIDEAISAGGYFTANGAREIIIGSKLAEILEVAVGDRVVLTVAQAADSTNAGTGGDLSQEMFRVSGIYHFNIQEFDAAMAFIRLEKAQEMLALGNGVHEIALQFTDTKFGRDRTLPFWVKYSRFGNEAAGWTVILPQLEAVFELSRFSLLITGVILFGVVALGIVNTLFMSLHERMFEFGVLRAVGTRPFAIARLIIFEAGALAILSIALGAVIGLAATFITAKIGIDYTGIEFAGVTFRELIYPVAKPKQYFFYPLCVFIFTAIVGLYPATFAARLSPAGAMRKSL